MKSPELAVPDVESTAGAGRSVESGDDDPRRSSGRAETDDGPVATTRRRVLGGIAGATVAGLAGCSSLTGGGDGDGGGGSTEWAEWAPLDLVDSDRSGAQAGHFELPDVYEEFPSSYIDQDEFESVVENLGISGEDLEEVISIAESEDEDHAVMLGSFSASDVTDRFSVEPASYEGYDVLAGEIAVDDGVIVLGTPYETIIDAKEGSVTNLLEADGEWPDVVENASSGTVSGVEPADSDDPWEVSGFAATGDGGSTVSLTAYAHFTSAEAAEENRDAVEEDVTTPEDPDDTPMDVDSVTVDGNVVVVEGTTQADEL